MRLLFAVLALAALSAAGCNSHKNFIAQQARTIDSLYVVERTMRFELYALQDSILFYDEIDSGLYFRKQRALEDRITQLEFMLAEGRDSLCVPDTIATLPVDDLFEPGSAALRDDGAERLDGLAALLDSAYAGHRFRVEGHTDNVPLGAALRERYPSNWELSAARAASVVRHLIDTRGLAAARFEVAAYGDARPVASNDTARGRRRNRRVTIRLLPR